MTARRSRNAAALLSAFLLFLAFRPLHWFFVIWMALVPLLRAAQGQPPRERFRLGFLFGFAGFTAVFHWMPIAIFNGRWLLPLEVLPALLLALLAWLATCLVFALGCGLILLIGLTSEAPTALAPLRLACVWLTWEWTRTLGALGFEGGSLALSQRPFLNFIQNADLVTVYGLSAVIAAANASLAFLPVTGRTLFGVGTLVLAGCLRGEFFPPPLAVAGTGRVALLQPNIPSREKVSARLIPHNLPILESLTASAAAGGAELVLWPETMIPASWTLSPELRQRMQKLVNRQRCEVLIGANERETPGGPLYNQSVLLTPTGERGRVRKRRLVLFGEYVPLKAYLPPLRFLSPGNNDYHSGPPSQPLPTRVGRMGVLICFESTFSAEARRLARAGAEFLVVVTNDDWFRGTGAMADHTDWAVFRAIETRRWIVQAANTGDSFFVDPRGRRVRALPLDQRGLLAHRVERITTLTPATRFGDLLPLLCLLATLLWAGPGGWRRSDRS